MERLDLPTAKEQAAFIRQVVDHMIDSWTPVSFWDDKSVFIVVLVEKVDLKHLFTPICQRYRVPIAIARGWSEKHTRGRLIEMLMPHIRCGRRIVLLYASDFDPGGLSIFDKLSKNILELNGCWYANDGDRCDLRITAGDFQLELFCLTLDQIESFGLGWISNLHTGSSELELCDPRHASFADWNGQRYIRDHCDGYLRTLKLGGKKRPQREYWVTDSPRKCEANALLTHPQAAADICEAAILKHLGDRSCVDQYEAMLKSRRPALRKAFHHRNGRA